MNDADRRRAASPAPVLLLKIAGTAVPLLYFGTLLLSSLFYPGYSHVTQYASELGSAAARWPAIFNTGIVLTGVAGILAGIGFILVFLRRDAGRLPGILAGAFLSLLGASLIVGGLYPMPDPRHGSFGIGMVIHLSPLLLALALRTDDRFRLLRRFLWLSFILLVTFFLVMMGVGGLVTTANVGVFQRVYALCMFPWIGIAAWRLGSASVAASTHDPGTAAR